ncbi:MAG: hypothetical protein A3E87_08600 [Gammaproteobacteria bacterium RIFCSPHIGHO2_12_FULL_35_23]|nr:MAG: hypothetical protein A3E87_08600 [Gammaproteobacteria bacterium RIFCSPHIGHO2_12_FULL_35_23]
MHNIDYPRYRQAKHITLIGAAVNLLLSIVKILFGWLGHSTALIADGIHSFSDLVTDFLVLYASKAGSHGPDADHPYGHERIETFATVALAAFLIMVGLGILVDSIREIMSSQYGKMPSIFVIVVAAASVVVNELLFYYTLRTAKRIESGLLRANAWHRRSDSFSSIVVLIGVIGTLLGVHFMDSLAAMIVALMIVKMGGQMAWQSIRELIDTGIDEQQKQKIIALITATPGVKAVHQMRSRTMGGKYFIDVHLQVDPRISVSEGHYIGDKAYLQLRQAFLNIKDITIHIDPEDDEETKPNINLPNREQIMTDLNKHCQNLPGWKNLLTTRLDYLAGKIYIQLVMPLSLLSKDLSGEEVQSQYCTVLANIETIAKISIVFQV